MHEQEEYSRQRRISTAFWNFVKKKIWRDCRTYYRFAFFTTILNSLLHLIIVVLSIIMLNLMDALRFSLLACFITGISVSIFYLLRFSNQSQSSSVFSHVQSHIFASSFIAFLLFAFSSFFHASYPFRICVSGKAQILLGIRCVLYKFMDGLSWVAPSSMVVAAWVLYFSALRFSGASPMPIIVGWRQVHISEVLEAEEEGAVSLP
ncbi:hypothetical protein BDQ12DRAFT_686958 [Crucibulum laeve]|uniref:Uncharacterized protein n=1 Tax=Crucibulum laeve TaxID=68775 RepID=A0A5C3LUU6_9AGAR|nr:hypothetical protein BDQ12DRAFT_686958 [Crucibulum laeve]